MRHLPRTSLLALGLASVVVTPLANAGPLALYQGPATDKNSIACGTFGDLVSCSAPFLNYLNGLAQNTTTANNGYVLPTPQGLLKEAIVVQAGGAAALDNSDTSPLSPSGGQVENAFKTNRGSDNFLATGKADGTNISAGNMSDPANNNLVAGADNVGTWDVSAVWLKDALTLGGLRHELMIGFDYNQPQSSTTSVDYWGLITVRDVNGKLADINFEVKSHTGQSYSDFTSSKNFASAPASTDFQAVSGSICVYANTTFPNPGGSCPSADAATGALLQTIDNSQGTENAEFLAFLPELNSQLDNYIAQGYDTISVRLLFGCFGGSDPKNGQGYLSDGGQTTNCDGGGFGDVFLLAGAPMDQRVPEPSTLALAGLGLLGAVRTYRRRMS